MNDYKKTPYPTEDNGAKYWIEVSEGEYEQHSNNVQTECEQGLNNVQTGFEQGLNKVQTNYPQSSSDTEKTPEWINMMWGLKKARESKDSPMTEETYLEENERIVNALMDNDFVSATTNYTSYKEIPMSMGKNKRLEQGFRLKGIETSPNTIAKVAACMRYLDLKNNTITKFKAKALCVCVAVAASFLTTAAIKTASHFDGGTSGPSVMMASIEDSNSPNHLPDVGKMIAEFEKKNRFTFYPYRKGVVEKEIVKSGDYSAANCEIILQRNMAAQIQATKR